MKTRPAVGSIRSPRRRSPLLNGILLLQDPEGLVFCPWDRVALLRDEGTGRVEATTADGLVAHGIEPLARLAGGPWIRIAPGVLAHPRYARREGADLVFPGGWRVTSDVELPPPAPPPSPSGAVVPGIGVRPDEVLYVAGHGRGSFWMTDRGRIPAHTDSGAEAARRLPGLAPIGNRFYFHPMRLRRIRRAGTSHWRVVLDDGSELPVSHPSAAVLLQALALGSLTEIGNQPPAVVPLFREGVRDFPQPLKTTPTEELKAIFGHDRRRLLVNLAWQVVRLRRAGMDPGCGTSERAFWYLLALPVLSRLLGPSLAAEWCSPGADSRAAFLYLAGLLADLVGKERMFTYEELGFVHERPELRVVGKTHPEVILALEKDTIAHIAHALADRFGCSLLIFGGQPKLLQVETFVRDLCKVYDGPVKIMAWVDYDPEGWVIADAFQAQLLRYGVRTSRLRHLILPSRFTAEELALAAEPLEPTTAGSRTLLARWMDRTHGVDGRPLGIHCDWLRDLDRLEAIVRREGGLR